MEISPRTLGPQVDDRGPVDAGATAGSCSGVALLEWSADPFEPRWCPWIVAVTVDPGGVPKHAILTAGSGGGGRCQSWPHGLLAGERADEDQPSLLTVRTDPRFDPRDLPHAWGYEWRGGRGCSDM